MNIFPLRRCLVLVLALCALPIRAATTAPTVLELFTSQGCNSCPPADALLGELAQRSDVLALAFHVDYWDYLGWRDAFALPMSAQRQQQYGEKLRLHTMFTPQLIVDGRRSVLGSNRQQVTSAIQPQSDALLVKLSTTPSHLLITLPSVSSAERLDVTVITYRAEATTTVRQGENAGKALREFNIVRSLLHLDSRQGVRDFELPLSSLPNDADHVAVLLQQAEGRIVGAAAIALH